jgi:hypothetical protein
MWRIEDRRPATVSRIRDRRRGKLTEQSPMADQRPCLAGVLGALTAVALAVAGCTTPAPGTSGLTQGGQQCEICRLQNPGDNQACFAVCLPRIDQLPAAKGSPTP